jgi:hypothetical protein
MLPTLIFLRERFHIIICFSKLLFNTFFVYLLRMQRNTFHRLNFQVTRAEEYVRGDGNGRCNSKCCLALLFRMITAVYLLLAEYDCSVSRLSLLLTYSYSHR